MDGAKGSHPVLVLLGGELMDFPIRPAEWTAIVAADGGALHALRQNVVPDYIVGDLDSLSDFDRERAAGATFRKVPRHKDFTDGEMAIEVATELGGSPIVLAGALGGRFDHTLGNLFLLEGLHQRGITAWATDGRQRAYWLADTLNVPGRAGDILSIIPLSVLVDGVCAQGVRWPLQGERLRRGATRSLSNEFVGTIARLTAAEGVALVVTCPAE